MLSIIVAGIPCAVFAVIFLITYFKSKGVYDEYLEPIGEEEYSLQSLLPVGLYFNDLNLSEKLLPAKIYASLYKYKLKVAQRIIELKGARYSDYYIMLHYANRISIAIFVAFLASLLALVMATTGDKLTGYLFAGISVALFFATPLLIDNGLNKKIEERRASIRLDFPEFVNKLTVLVNAGMTISGAWQKISNDAVKTTPLFTELKYTLADIDAGTPEAVAYEEFARRCKIKEIIKFVSVIVLNLKRGGPEVVMTLKLQSAECWEMRKAAARQLGEQAGTKILLPLMIMFLGTVIIVVLPALLNFSMGM